MLYNFGSNINAGIEKSFFINIANTKADKIDIEQILVEGKVSNTEIINDSNLLKIF